MIYGLDTSFIVALEMSDHPHHSKAKEFLVRAIAGGARFALAPQVMAELVHVITDAKRFRSPLSVEKAILRAESWWNAEEIQPVYAGEAAVKHFCEWLFRLRLGRKRLLDTMLAATYYTSGITRIATLNPADFAVFGCFEMELF
jgi:predicted nucleic acid-binding protein